MSIERYEPANLCDIIPLERDTSQEATRFYLDQGKSGTVVSANDGFLNAVVRRASHRVCLEREGSTVMAKQASLTGIAVDIGQLHWVGIHQP